MVVVQVYYSNEIVKKVHEVPLTFFIRVIRYRISLLTLCDIYGFSHEPTRCIVPLFLGQSEFWAHLASGHFDSGTATQTDIRHPTVRYFLKVLANTLLCKMEPNKVRVQELTLLFYTVRNLVPLGEISEPSDDLWPTLGAVFAEHLAKLKMKPIGGKGRKKETVGNLLTPVSCTLGSLWIRPRSVGTEHTRTLRI